MRVRTQRPPPVKDDKILTDNNALMIVALARAARLFGTTAYCTIAEKTFSLLLSQVVQHDHVFHRVRDGHVSTKGFLNDYAYLIWALIELYQTTFNATYLAHAQRLCDAMITRFYDTVHDGFTIMDGTTDLPVTYRDVYGTVTLSGNAVAALDLLFLGKLTGRTDYLDISDRVIAALSPTIHKTPHAFVDMLLVLDVARRGTEVVVVGDIQASDTKIMIEALHKVSNTCLLIIHRPPDETLVWTGFNHAIQRMSQLEGKATAYVCHGTACLPPTTDIKSMMSLIHEKPTKR